MMTLWLTGGAPSWLTMQPYLGISASLMPSFRTKVKTSTDKIWEFMAKLFLLHEVLKQASMDMFPLATAVPKAAREHAVFA